MADFDLAIIGGGINGAGIARDAAGRGLRVLLVEQNDLASGTSSASTKLIHGGLRYLEHGWFRLVREALIEREVLLRMAPHLIRPMRFVLPPAPGLRPAWMLRAGLFIYDHLGGRKILPRDAHRRSARDPLGAPLSADLGASNIPTAGSTMPAWSCSTRSMPPSAAPRSARAPAACGRARRDLAAGAQSRRPRDRDRARAGQCGRALDRAVRRVGTAPALGGMCAWSRAATSWCAACSSTTAAISSRRRRARRVRAAVRARFHADRHHRRGASSAIWRASAPSARRDRLSLRRGERAISATRFHADGCGAGRMPACARSMTTARRSRRIPRATTCCGSTSARRGAAAHRLWRQDHHLPPARRGGARAARAYLPVGPAWTADTQLPGGDFPHDGVDALVAEDASGLAVPGRGACAPAGARLWDARERILGAARQIGRSRDAFGADLTGAEVRYLMEHEWAQTADDVLWRRSKLGLRVTRESARVCPRSWLALGADRRG